MLRNSIPLSQLIPGFPQIILVVYQRKDQRYSNNKFKLDYVYTKDILGIY
jgi:hypothetical protein